MRFGFEPAFEGYLWELSLSEPTAPPAPVAEDVADVADVAEEAGEDDGPKVLSKKEKERLKKEKDKVISSYVFPLTFCTDPHIIGKEEGASCRQESSSSNRGAHRSAADTIGRTAFKRGRSRR